MAQAPAAKWCWRVSGVVFLDAVLHDAPEFGVVLAQVSGQHGHGNVLGQAHDHGFEEKAESASLSAPWNGDLECTVGSAIGARVTNRQQRLELEEVQVVPRGLSGVVDRALCVAFEAREPGASFEVDAYPEFAGGGVEIDGGDLPRRGDSEGRAEQLPFVPVRCTTR